MFRSVVSLGGGGDRPGWHPSGRWQSWHPKEKILWANLQRIVEKRGRTGKERCGVTSSRGWYPSEINKKWQWWAKKVVSFSRENKQWWHRRTGRDGDDYKKGSQFFQEKNNRGVTSPWVAAPGVTRPIDAAGFAEWQTSSLHRRRSGWNSEWVSE